jgi:release factor glutamine methyltransferase
MKIIEALKKYPDVETELLLSHILKTTKEFLFMNGEKELTRNQEAKLTLLISRRLKGEPVAYILGYKDFFGYRFKVNKHVLIPRPETEGLVELALDRIKNYELRIKNAKVLKILDVGTGSGCVAVSLAKILPGAIHASRFIIHASDISSKALKVAKENALRHKAKIKFIHSDLFKNISGQYDVVVANLPYVPMKMLRKHLLHRGEFDAQDPFAGLKYEPKFALTDGTSIWLIYKRFFEEVRAHLYRGAVILLEIDPSARKFLTEYQKKYLPQAKVNFYRDSGRLWRYMEIKMKGSHV